ncbi:glycerol kinase GlpK [Limibacter armeniacum]|uniref:glycerol kinase GlpK n=1 Tax=Limibacter armeniacum TaxID=466084 RepID=UPI002FE57B7B
MGIKEEKYILAMDQGTTSSRAIIFDHKGRSMASAQKEFKQYYPKPGWIEHDPQEIWYTQVSVAAEAIAKMGISESALAAIGITNQRETTILWDKQTGKPVYNAIVWQDRRTSNYCDTLKERGIQQKVREKTGLVIDAYFSATKIKWILDNVEGVRERAEAGHILFGTVDSWLIWKFTNGKKHVTDVTNASRTLLYNINTLEWDMELLEVFDIPESILPEVCSSSEVYGYAESLGHVPIAGVAGDQQAALFGQLCTEKGMVKNTYGTGCFLVMNTGSKPVPSQNNLLSTIAWKIGDRVDYAIEGSVFVGGAVVQWIRDGLHLIKDSAEIERLARTVDDNGGVYFVPALTGLGAPHWDQYARGMMIGLTRGTTAGHIARAALESICFQSLDLIKAMEADTELKPKELRVDGGAVVNNLLIQFQSDIVDFPVVRPETLETTALGVAQLAGLAVGYWESIDELKENWRTETVFESKLASEKQSYLYRKWTKALERCKEWADD